MAAQPAALAPHYYAISPTEGVTSAHDLSPRHYSNLFENKEIRNLNDLFSELGLSSRLGRKKLQSALVEVDPNVR